MGAKIGSDLGWHLRNLRLARGLTQVAAAQLVGRSEHWLVDLEAGKIDPRLSDVAALTALYRTPGKPVSTEEKAERRELHRAVCKVLGVREDEFRTGSIAGSATDHHGPQALKVAIAVVTDGPKVLLVSPRNRPSGDMSWQFPAGVVKPGTNAAMVAVQETYSETGVHCAVRDTLGARLHPITRVFCEYFLCQYLGGTAENRDVVENVSTMWVERDVLTNFIPAERTFPPIIEALTRDGPAPCS